MQQGTCNAQSTQTLSYNSTTGWQKKQRFICVYPAVHMYMSSLMYHQGLVRFDGGSPWWNPTQASHPASHFENITLNGLCGKMPRNVPLVTHIYFQPTLNVHRLVVTVKKNTSTGLS